jgi:hypothetical protein
MLKKIFELIDFEGINTYSIKGRKSKVSVDDIGHPVKKGGSFKEFQKQE